MYYIRVFECLRSYCVHVIFSQWSLFPLPVRTLYRLSRCFSIRAFQLRVAWLPCKDCGHLINDSQKTETFSFHQRQTTNFCSLKRTTSGFEGCQRILKKMEKKLEVCGDHCEFDSEIKVAFLNVKNYLYIFCWAINVIRTIKWFKEFYWES